MTVVWMYATEDFTGFFVGHAGTFGDIIAFDNIYFKGEQQIPLIPFIYHGKTSFGMKTSSHLNMQKRFFMGNGRRNLQTHNSFIRLPIIYSMHCLSKYCMVNP